eukprot:gnl/MRDRNA2_/MRDRNA2_117661_c0_seq1.p1 gnl/MRDRNA2_/MRDRNA2_117661_c0~~gnl/MRDRNA2_/MRDRNA2_117661_c0_seq1.p1  ORF type:complete len:271 (-),score=32.13 gnl/MRDRNA2_/MRDRNA2_117661_c0_seq1:116-886(-)
MATVRWQNICENQRLLAGLVKDIEALEMYHDDPAISQDIKTLSTTVCSGCVPFKWENFLMARPAGDCMEPSRLSSLAVFISHLERRMKFQRTWHSTKTFSQEIFSLNAFASPKLLFMALRAEHAKTKNCNFEDCVLIWEVSTEANRATLMESGVGICVTGIMLEICRWMTGPHSLATCLPFEMHSQLPMVHIKPVQKDPAATEETSSRTQDKTFRCPLFRSHCKSDFIADMELPCTEDKAIFRSRGAAAYAGLGIL